MNNGRTVKKQDIREWMRRGLAFMGVGVLNAAMVVMALVAHDEAPNIRPIIIDLFGGAAMLLFCIATLTGVRYMRKYRRYKRYFDATGLTRCSEENVTRWLATRDVTK